MIFLLFGCSVYNDHSVAAYFANENHVDLFPYLSDEDVAALQDGTLIIYRQINGDSKIYLIFHAGIDPATATQSDIVVAYECE